jgi:hypothetical protein
VQLLYKGPAKCPICGEKTNVGALATISPWVRELGIKSRISKFYLCKVCDTGFFAKRYTEEEMTQIYKDYRGSNYVELRSKWEPWYTKSYNSKHDSGEWVDLRKKSLTDFLTSHEISSCDVMIDVGGDRGQYIPDFAKNKIVIDLSEKELNANVRRVNSIESAPNADLVIYAHVLEHVVDPIYELEKLFKKTDKVYVEVPYGVPEINKYRMSVWRFFIQQASSLHPKFWARSAHPATGRKVSQTKMLAQSEHLNFFSETSFRKMAEVLGVSLIIERNTVNTPDFSTCSVIQCLLTRSSAKIDTR